ncbi:hypothetical protein SCP_0301580 [Sparassis crispa]|uniref:Tyr recombinase domain-containing protein n=1 Tax=Sparassis crispa TaxID=139825 RepID=A0A401GEB0_9APHY|nr:hypothetical protein SCP_0301580 [Sparassis crispa]GBE80443.1 hypothetical protein SCP_0301580 [Sparassis crispa]
MPLRLSGVSEHERIITPYDADAFESVLHALGLFQRYPFLPRKLHYSFPIGDFALLLRTFAPPNHSSGAEHIDFIHQYISEQVSLGRMTGPYSQAQVEHILGSYFVSSPLAVVPKADSKKFRLVQNCSYQDEFGVSVNSQINSDDFPTKWGTAAEVAEIINARHAGDLLLQSLSGAQEVAVHSPIIARRTGNRTVRPLPGAREVDAIWYMLGARDTIWLFPTTCAGGFQSMSTADNANLLVRLSMHLLVRRQLVLTSTPHSAIFPSNPAQAISGTGVQGEPMDAIVDILEAHNIRPSRKWVDDLITFRFPVSQLAASGVYEYVYGLADIFRITDPLGVPWHQMKYSDYALQAVYSGFLWDLDQRSVTLPEEKRLKYLAKLTVFIAAVKRGCVSQRDVMSINGTLSHIVFVYPHGRAFLTNLCSFITSFSNPYAPRFAPRSVLSDMKWWFSILNVPNVARSLASRGPLQDLGIWVDASSSWGIGVIVCGEWSAWHWRGPINAWKGEGRDIGWAEMVAIELAVRTVNVLGYHNATILTSSAALVQLFNVMLSSLDPSTWKNYGTGLLCFTQFCDCLAISEDLRMPAMEPLLAAFIAQWSGSVTQSTVDTWMAGLSFWHALHGAPWQGAKMLKVTCSAISKTTPASKEKCAPVTVEHLYTLRANLDLSDSFDAAVYAVALGELVIPSAGAFDPVKHVARAAPVAYRTLPGGTQYTVFHVPWTKTTKQLGADIIATEFGDPSSAVVALRHHLWANARVPVHAPFFAFETSDAAGWVPMTRNWFLSHVNTAWEAAGFEHLTGHCFRIGGATELLLRGTHPDVVATQGSWKSRAFLEYWRKIKSILPLFISQSFTSSRLQLTSSAMDSFKKKYSL